MSTQQPHATSLIELHRADDGGWTATQPEVDLVGEGPDPGEAVADYGKQVSAAYYKTTSDELGEGSA